VREQEPNPPKSIAFQASTTSSSSTTPSRTHHLHKEKSNSQRQSSKSKYCSSKTTAESTTEASSITAINKALVFDNPGDVEFVGKRRWPATELYNNRKVLISTTNGSRRLPSCRALKASHHLRYQVASARFVLCCVIASHHHDQSLPR
jgi:hypothetical protein